VLEQAGLSRRVTAVVPTYAAAAFRILSTDLTGLIAGFAARPMAAVADLHAFRIPAHRWLRARVRDIVTAESGGAR
jgi:hypothetical protein